ncbi:Asp23/Gls24 family envelope stress response protein [Lipingzhangella sp. LS1_29]|uniref:Asp23/Gls24 family envelope stress response protein n=1 Tax=Lipingzhangella rawalii TaxID=2055835 RepID=A0ABU2H9G9_9ACTN|nr:Asp23/Gls24 family envelope stress response protein [Lipingzhangella rawalii]MDS1271958.1 Asp23/Gls24 family envelope stress response protein [Lipingzhangella rawalii]
MNVTTLPAATVPRQREVDPAGRGTTTIRERVVAKVARQAVAERAESRELAGFLGRLRDGQAAGVRVRLSGNVVTVWLRLALAYPVPLRHAVGQVRGHVRDRVQELTGLSVRRVDIEVTRLERDRSLR